MFKYKKNHMNNEYERKMPKFLRNFIHDLWLEKRYSESYSLCKTPPLNLAKLRGKLLFLPSHANSHFNSSITTPCIIAPARASNCSHNVGQSFLKLWTFVRKFFHQLAAGKATLKFRYSEKDTKNLPIFHFLFDIT